MSFRHIALTTSLVAAMLTAGPVSAQSTEPPSIDRKDGEPDKILERVEWFQSSRRAGTDSAQERAELRWSAVQQTRQALELQMSRRAQRGGGGQNFWVPKGPSPSTFGGWTFGNVAGRVSAIESDWTGGTLYVGTASGGLWKSTNDGLSWTQLLDNAGTMTVGAVAIDPNDPDVIWVGTGENVVGCESYFGIGLLRSGDGGNSWELRNGSGGQSLNQLSRFANVVIDPRDSNHLIVGGNTRNCETGSPTSGGLYSSNDGGLSWTQRINGQSIYEIVQDQTLLDTYWAATGNGIYKSVDNGVTWNLQTASSLPTGSTGRTELAVSPSDGNVVYALFDSPTSFWRTTDGGATWSQRSSGSSACDGQCFYNMSIKVDPQDPDTIYRGTVHVFRSVNGGSNWTDLSNNWGSSQKVHQDTHVVLMHPTAPGVFYVGSDGGIWKSENSGSSFINKNGNLNITQFYAVGVRADAPEIICGGAQDNSSLARANNDVWDLQTVTGDGFICAFDPVDPNVAYITSYPAGGYPNVWRSTTGAFGGFSDITGPGSGIQSGDRSNWVTPYVLDPQNPATLYLGTHRVYRSDNRGSSWTQVGPADLTGGSGSLKVLEVNSNFPDVIYSGSETGLIWRSADGGSEWSDLSAGLPARTINDIAADPGNPGRAFAVVGGFNTDHLWEWNEGSGWTARPGNLPNVPTNTVLLLSSDEILVGSDTGVFRSVDGGLTFVPYMAGLPLGAVVTDLKFNPIQSIVTAGTYGRGAWQVLVAPPQPLLLFDSILQPIQEIDGDGDNRIEPGETWSISPVLRNGGGEIATDVKARLQTSAASVTIQQSGPLAFDDITPGGLGIPTEPFLVTIDPDAECGLPAIFDVVDVTSGSPELPHADRTNALTLDILDVALPGPIEVEFQDNFDPAPQTGWTDELVTAGVAPCAGLPNRNDWQVTSKDAAHGLSFHHGNGPGGGYSARSYGWLYYGGKDSEDGVGISIPDDALSATLTIEHWYETLELADGGQVVLDTQENDQDVYSIAVPIGGYPSGVLASGVCNGLEGLPSFHGSSGGWRTDVFDLITYKGTTIYPAFVFGSDRRSGTPEGWYVDDVKIEIQRPGDPVCQVTSWPGSVPNSLTLDLNGSGDLVADWGDSCNSGAVPGQNYAVVSGSLDQLLVDGTYGHTALGSACDRTAPATFATESGNRYYLVVSTDGSHQSGTGRDSSGNPRPEADAACGIRREATCP